MNACEPYQAGRQASRHPRDARDAGIQMGCVPNVLFRGIYPDEENPRTLKLTGLMDYFPYRVGDPYVESWRLPERFRGRQITSSAGVVRAHHGGKLVWPGREKEGQKAYLGTFTALPPNCVGEPYQESWRLSARHKGMQMGNRSTGGRPRANYAGLPHQNLNTRAW